MRTALARNRPAEIWRFASKMETESILTLICGDIYFSAIHEVTNGPNLVPSTH